MTSQAYRTREQVLKCPEYKCFPPIVRDKRNAMAITIRTVRRRTECLRQRASCPLDPGLGEVTEVFEVSEVTEGSTHRRSGLQHCCHPERSEGSHRRSPRA
jgi:hypothetical protein